MTIYGRISANSANLAKIDAVDFDTIGLAEIVKTNKKIRNRDRTYSAHRAFQAGRAEKMCSLAQGMRKILRVSWTVKKTNEWVLDKAGVKRELLDTVKARKLAYYGHTMRKQGSCLKNEIMQETMPGARRPGRPRTAWMDNIKTWTGLPVEESIRMTEDRDKWRKYVHGVANPRIEDG